MGVRKINTVLSGVVEMSKKVVAIKRGEIIPDNAKWLKDENRVVREWEKGWDDHPLLAGWTNYEYAMFDIYEIEVLEGSER